MTSLITAPKGRVVSLNLDTHSARSSVSRDCNHSSLLLTGSAAEARLALKKYAITTSRGMATYLVESAPKATSVEGSG